jgi:hypothetical protein
MQPNFIALNRILLSIERSLRSEWAHPFSLAVHLPCRYNTLESQNCRLL